MNRREFAETLTAGAVIAAPVSALSSVDLHSTMDARIWAREFMRVTGGTVDEAWALSWFANAIMVGWDHRERQTPEYQARIAAVLGEER